MDRRLWKYYDSELKHLREMGTEFAREFPGIAGQLGVGMGGVACPDPFVERLMEGFAFLTARVQLKLDSEFPRFTQALLETVYPHYLAPTPAMTILQFQPLLEDAALAPGFPIPRHSLVSSKVTSKQHTQCTYTTGHDIKLWPLKVLEAKYHTQDLALLEGKDDGKKGAGSGGGGGDGKSDRLRNRLMDKGVKAAIRIRLQTTAGMKFSQLGLERLPFYIHGANDLQGRVYEQIIGHTVDVVIQPATRPPKWRHCIDEQPGQAQVKPAAMVGFEENQALLPCGPRSFQGYRLLQEYFAFRQRFFMFEVGGKEGLQGAFKRGPETTLDMILYLNRADLTLENTLSGDNFALHCTPAINLFKKSADRIHLTEKLSEFQVIPDRTRPLDFEVFSIEKVVGYGAGNEERQTFLPFYRARDGEAGGHYYTANRVPRLTGNKDDPYPGSETYVSLVDAKNAPYSSELKQLEVTVYCTNRALPMQIPMGRGEDDFTMPAGPPVVAIKSLVSDPPAPQPSYADAGTAWRLISHLSLNYLSLTDSPAPAEEEQGSLTSRDHGAAALRDLLRLYAGPLDTRGGANDLPAFEALKQQISGVRNISSRPVIRRVNKPGPISFARGLEVTVTLAEENFRGAGVFLLGAVLERFFSKYVSINSFTETVIHTKERGEVMRWPARLGLRHTL